MPPPIIPARRGYTLIELMLVIVLVSLVLGSVAVLIKGVWRANHAMQDHRTTMHSIQRLATQFRDDVHTAVTVELTGESLTIKLPSGKVATYELQNSAIQRNVHSAGQVANRDTFDAPPNTTIAFESPTSAGNNLASLMVSYPLGAMQHELSDRRTLRIDAAVGITPAKVELGENRP